MLPHLLANFEVLSSVNRFVRHANDYHTVVLAKVIK